MNDSIYCGNPGIDLFALLGLKKPPEKPVLAWFKGKKVYTAYTARTAIHRVVQLLKIGPNDEVLIPSYNCGSEIDPLYQSGAQIAVYRVDRAARIDFADVKARITGRTRAIYLTHYFGFLPDADEMAELCRQRNIALIEDCALSLFSESDGRKAGALGQFAVFSISKTLMVRAGALIVNDEKAAQEEWRMRRLKSGPGDYLPLIKASFIELLQAIRLPCGIVSLAVQAISRKKYDRCKPGPTRHTMADRMFFNPEFNDAGIAPFSAFLLNNIDTEAVIEKRRNNFLQLLRYVKERPGIAHLYHELPEGVCPLFFPVVVSERARLYAYLSERMIESYEWWFGYHPAVDWDAYPDACYLKDHLLQLPVHHRLHPDAARFIAAQVNAFQAVS